MLTWFPLSWAFLNFNHAVEPFNDARVRKALDLMVDKETLVQGALWGQGVVTASPSFPTSPSYNDALTARAQDYDAAKALLGEAGFGPGELEFVFKTTTNYPWHVEATQILVEWFRQGGVKASVQQLTWSDWLSQCWVDRDYQVTMMNFFTLWEPDFLYYSLWHSTGAFNYRNIKDAKVDELTEAARRVVDPIERAEIYKAVQKRVQDETLDVVLWFRNGTVAARPNVGGTRPARAPERLEPPVQERLAQVLSRRHRRAGLATDIAALARPEQRGVDRTRPRCIAFAGAGTPRCKSASGQPARGRSLPQRVGLSRGGRDLPRVGGPRPRINGWPDVPWEAMLMRSPPHAMIRPAGRRA